MSFPNWTHWAYTYQNRAVLIAQWTTKQQARYAARNYIKHMTKAGYPCTVWYHGANERVGDYEVWFLFEPTTGGEIPSIRKAMRGTLNNPPSSNRGVTG